MHIFINVVVLFVGVLIGFALRTSEAKALTALSVGMTSVWSDLSRAATKDEISLRLEVSHAVDWFETEIKKIKL